MVKGMYSNQTIVTDTHFEIGERLREALTKAINDLYGGLPSVQDQQESYGYAQSIIDDAFVTVHDLAMDVESYRDHKYNGRED